MMSLKNMIMQIMINLPKIFGVIFTTIKSVSVPNFKFGDFGNGLVCIFGPPTWLLQYKYIEISQTLTVTLAFIGIST